MARSMQHFSDFQGFNGIWNRKSIKKKAYKLLEKQHLSFFFEFDTLYTSYWKTLVLVERKKPTIIFQNEDLTIECTAFTRKHRGRTAVL